MTIDVKKMMDEIKRMSYFDVSAELPETFRFNGPVPFDLRIEDNCITAHVFAKTEDEAIVKLQEYLVGQSD
jgi:hypothetical protein